MIVLNLGAVPTGLRLAIVNWVRHTADRYKVRSSYRIGNENEDAVSLEDMEVNTATAIRAEYDLMMQNMCIFAEVATWA